MNKLTAEWVAKAEGDYATTDRELRVSDRPNYDTVCFHTQQTAEKYLKAFLQEHGVAFPKTRNLIELLELCLTLDNKLENMRLNLIRLGRYGVNYRYPGETAVKSEAQTAFESVTIIRVNMQARLGNKD